MPARMFGTAGVRGVINTEITPELTLRIAAAFTSLMRRDDGRRPTIGVGHDTRYGADVLGRAAASGACAAGADSMFYHVIPTGAFCHNVRANGHAGGILITGSHMPPDRTGIAVILDSGAYAPFSFTDRVEAILRDFRWEALAVAPDRIGHPIEAFHAFESYVGYMVQQVDAPLLKRRGFRVLCDPANGAASLVAMELFQWLGCSVEMMNYDPAPVPARPSEPRAASTSEAQKRVAAGGFDAAFCLDVDADRCLMIDESGRPLSEDAVGAIFAREQLGRGDLCVVPINSSGLIEVACEQAGARLEYCPVGQPHTQEAILARGAKFSYEESGKYYFPDRHIWPDGLFSAIRMLHIMARSQKKLSELAAQFPRFHQVKNTVPVPNDRKERLMRRVKEAWGKELSDGRRADYDLDGLKRVYDDRSWLLIRLSGTEELVRVYTDAPTEERARELADQGAAFVRRLLKD